MSLIGALNSGVSGMKVSQIGISTTSHNITNANTPGYVRQRVEQTAERPYYQPGLGVNDISIGQIGSGVTANGIVRIKNSFYDYQYRAESPSYGNTVTKYNYLTNMESIFNEPSDTALSSTIANFFNGFNELSKDPNNTGAKNIAIENAKYLTTSLNKLRGSLDKLHTESLKEQSDMLNSINTDINRLFDIEKQIKIIENTGKAPNDLMDLRDSILDDLSSKIDLTNPNIEQALRDGNLTLDEVKNFNIDGALKGLLEVQDTINEYNARLGNLMLGIAEGINNIYKSGANADTKNIFELTMDGTRVIGMEVNKDFTSNPSNLKMSSDKALELMNFRNVDITIGGGTMTVVEYYNSIVQDLGHTTQNMAKLEANQSKLLNNINTNKWGVAGVSQDEELVNLVQYQHAYNASAKIVSTVDNLLDVVINGMIR